MVFVEYPITLKWKRLHNCVMHYCSLKLLQKHISLSLNNSLKIWIDIHFLNYKQIYAWINMKYNLCEHCHGGFAVETIADLCSVTLLLPVLHSSASLSSSRCSDAVRKSSSIEDTEQFVSSSGFRTWASTCSCLSWTSSSPIRNLFISKMMQLVLCLLSPRAHWTKQTSASQGHWRGKEFQIVI